MPSPKSNPAPNRATSGIALAGGLIVFVALVAYLNSLSGALVYDDRSSITENASIRQFSSAFSPPGGSGTGGRPVANFTFAVSYALSGLHPWAHHLVNLGIHALTALALFGVVRRTLLQPVLRSRFGQDARPLATVIAALWVAHPLTTQTVTYLSQRTEGLMALFYLLTLYCFIRGTETRPRLWHPLAVAACLLGVMSKEIIATAPLLVLLYDRTFAAGTFAQALRLRLRLYLALAATWLPLALLLIGVRQRGVGYGLGIPWVDYALTECQAVLLYLKLSVWPHPLIFDRGLDLIKDPAAAAPFALLLVAVLAAVVWALRARPVLGFVGAFFFVILAPASSVIPVIQQPIAENRPYLPSAAIVALGVTLLYLYRGRRTVLVVGAILMAICVLLTARRNRDFATEISIWADTVEKCPQNARAHYNLGVSLDYAGRTQEAVSHYQTAIQLSPTYPEPYNNLGNALAEHSQIAEALPFLQSAIRLRPTYADAHYNLGNAFLNTNRLAEAADEYQASLRLDPNQPKARNNLGIVFFKTNLLPEAIKELEAAAALSPTFADPHNNLAAVLSQSGRIDEAIAQCEIALQLNPGFASARDNLARLRAMRPPAVP